MLCMILCKDLADFIYCSCITHKGGCNKINILRDSKKNIFSVFFCNRRKLYLYIRYIYSFSLSQFASVYDLTYDFILFNGIYQQFNQTIINQNPVSFLYFFDKSGIRDGTSFFIPCSFVHIEGKGSTALQHDFFSTFQQSGTNFRSFGIQKNRYWFIQFFPYILQQIHTVFVFLMVSM